MNPESLEPETCRPEAGGSTPPTLLREGNWVAAPCVPPAPSCCGVPGDDELTRAALEDPAALDLGMPDDTPTVWRVVALIVFAVTALGIVFAHR